MTAKERAKMTQLAAAKDCAAELLAEYQRKAPDFLATFTPFQKEMVADFMAAGYLEGMRDGITRVMAPAANDS